jgi:hypothetical protein
MEEIIFIRFFLFYSKIEVINSVNLGFYKKICNINKKRGKEIYKKIILPKRHYIVISLKDVPDGLTIRAYHNIQRAL